MSFWYLRDLARLEREQAAVAELAASAEWLASSVWMLDGTTLTLNAVIHAHGHDYPVRLCYPHYFPSSPPTLHPVGAETRWTSHQYGDVNGALCLEWGSDNWQPDVTGAQVLESAYRLFDIENPLGEGANIARTVAPSRHKLTQGQELRFNRSRLYVSPALRALLTSSSLHSTGTMKFSWQPRQSASTAFIFEVQVIGSDDAWHEQSIPSVIKGFRGDESLSTGAIYKTALSGNALREVNHLSELVSMLQQAGYDTSTLTDPEALNPFGLSHRPDGVLLIDDAEELHFFFILSEGGLWRWLPVYSDEADELSRQPENIRGLSETKVSIVGLGSAGSKIAESLARMGVGTFYLVDYDIFLPENIARHSLDWRHVAEHKVDAVKDIIQHISPSAQVVVSRLHLTGQESSAALDGVLQCLGESDIIIDATANPHVFNLLTHIATADAKPLVWLEVYGGGGGGMIARSRPGIDPTPHVIRATYNSYCIEHPAPETTPVADYTIDDGEGRVLSASDADVGIIALHAARFAIDTVLDQNSYPYSLYLIGLSRWWVFDQPFQTIPVDIGKLSQEKAQSEADPELQGRAIDFIDKLLAKRADATNHPS